VLLKVFPGLVYAAVKGIFSLDVISVEMRLIRPALYQEFGPKCSALMLSANQRHRILKEDLGFEIGASHGKSRVYLTIPLLVNACDDYGIKDELIEQWRKKLEKQQE